jgi:hypothetical protein
MADFYQTGVIATLHRLGEGDLGNVERQLEYFSRQQPIAVVLPALYSEFQKAAMDTILAELCQVNYFRQFVVTLAQATAEQFDDADAMINGLLFDRHAEEIAVETFCQALKLATDEFFADPLGAPPIPNWMRVSAALPGFLDDLREAVDADNEVLTGAGRLWAAG